MRHALLLTRGRRPRCLDGQPLMELDLDGPVNVARLAGQRYDRVLLHDLADDELLPSSVLRDIFSRPIESIRHIDDAGVERPYRPFAHLVGKARVLNVFPGAPIPVDKGANQRVFSLTWHLNRAGIATDLLLTTASRRQLPHLGDVLTAIAPSVHTYVNDKPLLPPRQRVRREVERLHRLSRGVVRKAPDLFVDRLATRASRDGKRRLAELVSGGGYEAVIVNFAWMTGLVDAARARATRQVTWICDTHDVQFVRGASQNRRERRLRVSHGDERAAELAQLSKYDAVLAISESDDAELRRHLGDRVVLAPSGFDYALRELAPEPARPPYTYGFIGRAMDANVAALEELLRTWWPAICARSPNSRLLVAGTICKQRAVRQLVRGRAGVELLGFVPTLEAFYSQIQIALNPVVVQGGLNFKSLEAAAAGCLLVTTELGARCLGDGAPVLAVDDADALGRALQPLLDDPAALHEARLSAQRWCMDRYSEDRAYRGLRELLGG